MPAGFRFLRCLSLCLLPALLTAAACSRPAGPPADSEDALRAKGTALLDRVRGALTGGAGQLVYTWVDEQGSYQRATDPAAVPDECAGLVIVTPVDLPPEERLSDRYLVVANLAAGRQTGDYRLVLEDRTAFERAMQLRTRWKLNRLRDGQPAPTVPVAAPPAVQGPRDQVVLYSAAWCGYCRKVRQLLVANDVSFVERDIEKDPAALRELQAAAAADGVPVQGVPVVDFRGRLVAGYDPDRLNSLIRADGRLPAGGD